MLRLDLSLIATDNQHASKVTFSTVNVLLQMSYVFATDLFASKLKQTVEINKIS